MHSPNIPMVDYEGKGNPERLIPQMGSGYQDIPELKETAELLKKWQFKSAYRRLEEESLSMEGRLLKAEVLTGFEHYNKALKEYENILQSEPDTVYAMTMALSIARILGRPSEPFERTLKKAAPQLYEQVEETWEFIQQHLAAYSFPEINQPLDAIGIYGYVLKEDGTIPLVLENRLKKAQELAVAHPHAKVLLSGGDVQNPFSEAAAMKEWLLEAGIAEERLVKLERAKDTVGNVVEFREYLQTGSFKTICAVTTLDHLPRAWMSLVAALKGSGITVFGSAYEKTVDSASIEREVELTYPTVLRVAGLFTKEGIDQHLQYE